MEKSKIAKFAIFSLGILALSNPADAFRKKIKLHKIKEIKLECVEVRAFNEEDVKFNVLVRHDHARNATAIETVNEVPHFTSENAPAHAIDARVVQVRSIEGLGEIDTFGAGFVSTIVESSNPSERDAELKLDLLLPGLNGTLSSVVSNRGDFEAHLVSWEDESVLSTFVCEADIDD